MRSTFLLFLAITLTIICMARGRPQSSRRLALLGAGLKDVTAKYIKPEAPAREAESTSASKEQPKPLEKLLLISSTTKNSRRLQLAGSGIKNVTQKFAKYLSEGMEKINQDFHQKDLMILSHAKRDGVKPVALRRLVKKMAKESFKTQAKILATGLGDFKKAAENKNLSDKNVKALAKNAVQKGSSGVLVGPECYDVTKQIMDAIRKEDQENSNKKSLKKPVRRLGGVLLGKGLTDITQKVLAAIAAEDKQKKADSGEDRKLGEDETPAASGPDHESAAGARRLIMLGPGITDETAKILKLMAEADKKNTEELNSAADEN